MPPLGSDDVLHSGVAADVRTDRRLQRELRDADESEVDLGADARADIEVEAACGVSSGWAGAPGATFGVKVACAKPTFSSGTSRNL